MERNSKNGSQCCVRKYTIKQWERRKSSLVRWTLGARGNPDRNTPKLLKYFIINKGLIAIKKYSWTVNKIATTKMNQRAQSYRWRSSRRPERTLTAYMGRKFHFPAVLNELELLQLQHHFCEWLVFYKLKVKMTIQTNKLRHFGNERTSRAFHV